MAINPSTLDHHLSHSPSTMDLDKPHRVPVVVCPTPLSFSFFSLFFFFSPPNSLFLTQSLSLSRRLILSHGSLSLTFIYTSFHHQNTPLSLSIRFFPHFPLFHAASSTTTITATGRSLATTVFPLPATSQLPNNLCSVRY